MPLKHCQLTRPKLHIKYMGIIKREMSGTIPQENLGFLGPNAMFKLTKALRQISRQMDSHQVLKMDILF